MNLFEKVNLDKLENVLKCDNLIFKKGDDNEKKKEDCKKRLYTYYQNERDNGFLKVIYKESINSKTKSRLFGNGLQGMKREIRNYICDNMYYDFDIKNCHPNIIKYLFKKYNINDTQLRSYIDDRNRFLDILKISKEDFLSFINKSTLDKNNKNLKPLHDNIYINLIDKLKIEYKDLYDSIDKKWNKNGSFLNKVICMYERDILDFIIDRIKNKYKIEPNVLCFDGLMILKEMFGKVNVEEFVNDINNELSKHFDYDFKIVNKEMNDMFIPNINEDYEESIWNKFSLKHMNKNIYDTDLARIFLEFLNSRYIFNTNDDNFYYCDKETNIWTMDKSNVIINKKYHGPEFYAFLKEKAPNININKVLKKINQKKACFSVLKELIATTADFESNDYLFAFKNGVYDLKKNIFRKIEKEDYIVITCPYNYVERNTDRVYKYLLSLNENKKITDFKINSLSLGLCGAQLTKTFTIWTGTGDNGKSLEQKLIFKAFGKYAGTINPNFFLEKERNTRNADPELHENRFCRLILTSEPSVENKNSFNCNLIKKLTGNDRIKTRTLNEKPIEWLPKFKITMACNDIPPFTDRTKAWYNRIAVIHYPFCFCENPTQPNHRKLDRNIDYLIDNDETFCEEYLYLLIKYWRNIKFPLQIPEEIKVNVDEYVEYNDRDVKFIQDCLEKTGNVFDCISNNEMYERYEDWCANNNIKFEFIKSIKSLTKYLKMKDFVYNDKSHTNRKFICVKFKK